MVMLNRPPSRRSRECRHDFLESTDIDLGLSPSHSPRPHPNQNLLRRLQSWQLTWALGRYIGELRCAESQKFKVKLLKPANCLMSIQSSTRFVCAAQARVELCPRPTAPAPGTREGSRPGLRADRRAGLEAYETSIKQSWTEGEARSVSCGFCSARLRCNAPGLEGDVY
jgi:hypothetical protein